MVNINTFMPVMIQNHSQFSFNQKVFFFSFFHWCGCILKVNIRIPVWGSMDEVLGSLNHLSDLHCRSEYAVKYPFLYIYPRLYFAQFFFFLYTNHLQEWRSVIGSTIFISSTALTYNFKVVKLSTTSNLLFLFYLYFNFKIFLVKN